MVVIDTIVAEIQSIPGEDRCVLMLGYKEQMNEMFQASLIALVYVAAVWWANVLFTAH